MSRFGRFGSSRFGSPFWALLLASQFVPEAWSERFQLRVQRLPLALQGAALGVAMAWLILALAPRGVAPFIYFQF